MIDSKLNFHEGKSPPNHWLPTEGIVQYTCLKGFCNQSMSLEVGMESQPCACVGCAELALMTLPYLQNGEDELRGASKGRDSYRES